MLYTCHTYYSLLYGTMSVELLVEQAKKLGIAALAVTDINNTSACFDVVKLCGEQHIKPIVGVECREKDFYLYTCIAKNHEGLREINDFLTEHNLEQKAFSSSAPEFSNVFVLYAPGARSLNQLRENEYIGVRPWEISKIYASEYQRQRDKLVAQHQVTFARVGDHELHKLLRAMDHNTLLSMLKPGELARHEEYLVSPDTLRKMYRDYPDIIKNAEKLMDECSFSFDYKTPKNKRIFTSSRYDDSLLLEKLALEGMVYRYGCNNAEAKRRIKHELQVIGNLDFSAYFLIASDVIQYSMSRGIHHVGRGSGGNSIVAYCLKITDIDPIELDLYFERFINPQRTSPPDFDIDYSWTERDQVIDYIFKRHGRDHTALLGAINTFHTSSIIRELGKVYGLPKGEIDGLVDNPSAPLLQNDITHKIFTYGQQLRNFPHHRSIHAGGILISHLPITYYTALDLPPKNFATAQWDMYVAEDIGFEKLDILSQRGLGHIKECADIVLTNRGVKVDIHQVETFKHDAEVNQRLYNGEAIGCFYVESPAMRGLLKKLKCQDYIRLVAASSIIRPGVAQSGMMREYIRRFHHPDQFEYLHPVFEQQLKETFGVMVYQEDVLKICHHFAGLELSDADILRRAMSGKYRSKKELDRIHDTFFNNCRDRGYSDELAAEVWRQIASFSGYSFCKAHSASYAVESYQSLYLKTYFPNEFHVAVINNFGGFYQTWVYVNEAKRYGAKINLPCINKSNNKTCIYKDDIYLGFIHLKNLEANVVQQIIAERELHGEYKSMPDFTQRVSIGLEQLLVLVRIGAFRFTGKTKKELMWEAHLLLTKEKAEPLSNLLFAEPVVEYKLPELKNFDIEHVYDEIELLGFPVSMSRFDMLQTDYRGNANAQDLYSLVGKTVRMTGDLVTIKYVQTIKKEIMNFGCFLDVHGEFFDTVHFPDSLKKHPFTGQGVYLLQGKVVEEFGFPSVEVQKLARLPYRPDPRID
jgi:error-prone DNA polymerase